MKVKIKKVHPDARSSSVECAYCGKEEIVPNSRAKGYKYCSKECMKKAYLSVETPKEGERINNWEVIKSDVIRKYGRKYIAVRCTCGSGVEHLLPYHHYIDKQSLGCKECSKHFTNKGVGEISGSFWALVKSGASKRSIPFDININEAWDLYLKQGGVCALSGVDISFAPTTNKRDRKYQTASLDRIDSSKGYTIDNVQWVHKDANIMKNRFSMDYFSKFAVGFASKANLKVKIKRLTPNSVIPHYAKDGDAGLDLTATSMHYDEEGNVCYGTGLAFEIPKGYVGLIFPRSSICKKEILLSNSVGVIDSGYRGEVSFKFKPSMVYASSMNLTIGKDDRVYSVGERVGQIIIMPYPSIEFVEVDELSETERGEGGYGSSGK